ncbi:MAG: hypothetical protein IKK75_07165, partial [Clostridia bacterium]|nr:hypothetical protein [Clostridia bacterium]
MSFSKPGLLKSVRAIIWVALDVLLISVAVILAQVVRYSPYLSTTFYANSLRLAPAMLVIFLVVFYAFGMYRTMWQYMGSRDVLRIMAATLVASLLTYGFSVCANLFVRPVNLFRLHRMVYLLLWLFSFALVCASRLFYRLMFTQQPISMKTLLKKGNRDLRRVMVIGAGWTGASVVHDMQRGVYGGCVPVIVLDDDAMRTGSRLSGVPVVRGT